MKLPPALLLVVSLLLLSLGIISGYVISSDFLGGTGQFELSYASGSSPIVAINFDLPHDLATSITVGNAGGFTPTIQGDNLRLTGGTLGVGQTLTVSYHLNHYINPGSYNFTSAALTGNGQQIITNGQATVQENIFLQIFTAIADNSLLVEVLGAVGTVGAGAWILRDSLKGRDEGPLREEAPTPGVPPTGPRPVTQEKPTEIPDNTPTVPQAGGDKFPAPRTEEKKKPKKLGVDLTMCPRDWMPKGTNNVSFTAVVYMCVPGSGWVPSDTPVKIKFRLSDVSNQTGICLNKGKSKTLDLWFSEKENPTFKCEHGTPSGDCEKKILGEDNEDGHHHYQEAVTIGAVLKATVKVRSEDFGAWGSIEATAEGCVQIPARKDTNAPVNCPGNVCCAGSNKVSIPFDTNGNHIPDVAPQDSCGDGETGAKKDEDNSPKGDGTKGDGLTAYEEYRGFFVNEGDEHEETHVRTDIDKKDVFVYIDDKELDKLGYFKRTGLEVHKITDAKLVNGDKKREINFNRGYASGGLQHALWLHRDNNLLQYGRACGLTGQQGPGDDKAPELVIPTTPGGRDHVCVNLEKCTNRNDYQGLQQPPGRLEQVIAHELGHGVNLPHHGDGKLHKHPHSGRQEGDWYYMKGIVTSGPTDCIMRYDRHAEGWCTGEVDNLPAHVRHQTYWDPNKKDWIDKPGTHYCSSKTGDGVNKVGNETNDATNGNCQNLIKVKDW